MQMANAKGRGRIDRSGNAVADLMNLSKSVDCIRHDLLIGKLHAYGFSYEALTVIRQQLNKQATTSEGKWFLQFLEGPNMWRSSGIIFRPSISI